MPSQTKENYLKAIYNLADTEGKVSLSQLSKQLEVSSPTVNNMIKKLEEKAWVKYEKYKPIELTPSGKTMAALIIRKHRITEMFLVEKMNFGWEEVHEIAEEMEHLNSNVLFERMDEMLGYPAVDPHGSPIPNKKGEIIKNNYLKLSELKAGESGKFCALTHSSSDFLKFLNNKKISLGTVIEVESIEAFDQSLLVNYDDQKQITLSKTVVDSLLVDPLA